MYSLRSAFLLALGLLVACDDMSSSTGGEQDVTLTGGACPVTTCTGTGCESFTPTDGEYLVDDGLKSRSAPDTGAPFPPLIQRQIRVGEQDTWLRPSIPPTRTTADGRVGITQAGTFRAMRLEVLKDRPVMRSRNRLGDELEGTTVHMQGPDPAPKSFWNGTPITSAVAGPEVTICEYKQDQPYRCPGNLADDCYDVKVIQHVPVTTPDGHNHVGLESIPVTIRVTNPKTTSAEVVSVTATATKWDRANLAPFSAFEEGLNTRDGRLLVGRVTDINHVKGETQSLLPDGTITNQNFSLAYAYSETPCDVHGWFARTSDGVFTSLRPLAAAPYDTRINGQGPNKRLYGFAAHPFRDAGNHVLGQHDVLPGSYPWVDKEGRNVIFSTVDVSLFGSTTSGPADNPTITVFGARFPTKHTSNNEPLGRTGGSPRGFSVVGNWTEGKIVTLDDMLNNDDFGVFPDDEYEIGLYRAGSHTVAVRVNGGAKLDTGKLRTSPGGAPATAVANNHHIDSTENMTAMHYMSAAVTPRDVVWTISRGLNSDEVAFDDYIDPHVVLLGEMNAAWKFSGGVSHGQYEDGFQQDSSTHTFSQDPTAIRLQNSATSPVYKIADPGRIEGGGRVEPIAAGGVQGRGLWLESGADATWHFSDTTAGSYGTDGFYAGVFVDARESMQGNKHIFSFRPDSGAPTEVTITDGSQLHVTHGTDQVTFDVSCNVLSFAQRWHHFGVLFESTGEVTAFIDGNPLGKGTFHTPVQLDAGAFVIGGPAAASSATGIRGWYDEARVVVEGTGHQLTHAASVELLCNYARGTMLAVAPGAQDYDLAANTPSIHARIVSVGAARAPAGSYAYCATDYAGYTLANHGYSLGVHYTPANTTSMRASILLEGTAPLKYDQPRPDSTNRSFCLSCHIDEDPDRSESLTVSALTANGVASDLDSRTQPSQPPVMPGDTAAMAWGNIPKGWVSTSDGQSMPTTAQSGGVLLLRFLFRGQ